MEDNYGSDDEGMENFENEAEEGFSDDSEGSQDYTSEQPEGAGAGSEEEQEEEEQEEASEESQDNYEVLEATVPDQPNARRITSPFMTKFEKAKIIGVRAVQISKNAPLYLNSDNIANMNWDPLTIAEKELAEKRIPFIIRRYLPDGSYEDWKLSELKTFD